MWLNELYKRWMGRTSRRTRRRILRQRSYVRPRLEKLEDRTLLSAPVGGYTTTLTSGGGSTTITASSGQFSSNDTASGHYFLGLQNTPLNASVGGITNPTVAGASLGSYGLQANLNMNVNKLGLDMGCSASGGNVNATYQGVTLNQNFTDATAFNQEVNLNTGVSYGSGNMSTTGPSFSAYTNFDMNLNGSVSGTAAFGGSVSGSANFGVNTSLPVFNLNIGPDSNNQLALTNFGIFGLNLVTAINTANGGDVTASAGFPTVTKTLATYNKQIDGAPPLFIQGNVDLTNTGPVGTSPVGPSPFGVSAALNMGIGEVQTQALAAANKNNELSLPTFTTNLGSVFVGIPDIALSSSSLQSGGAVSATGQGALASMYFQAGPLAAALIGLPELASLTSTDSIDVGPVSLNITPVSFTIGPSLGIEQVGTVTPVNTLTYNFSSAVDVTKDGTDLGQVTSVAFTPGQDTIGIDFTDKPITVTPTWNFGLNYTNELDLYAAINGNLTAGLLSATYKDASVNLGPLYSKPYNFATYKLATIYDNTFSMYSESQQLTPFTIGGSIPTSLAVTETTDGNSVYNATTGSPGQLRGAVDSADYLGSSSYAQQVIQLGAGTYVLSLGQLDITAKNVMIQGAGAGQTFITAGSTSRIFRVDQGSQLTLVGVTLKDGKTGGDNPYGGAIYNSGTLDIKGSRNI